jgi:hypothetical protein
MCVDWRLMFQQLHTRVTTQSGIVKIQVRYIAYIYYRNGRYHATVQTLDNLLWNLPFFVRGTIDHYSISGCFQINQRLKSFLIFITNGSDCSFTSGQAACLL